MSYSLSKKFTFYSLIMFSLPTMIMMVVMSLYTIVDGIFVSRFVGTNALSSINIVYPLINIIMGVAIMLATGANAIIAKKMGEGCHQEARKVFSLVVFFTIFIGIIMALAGNLFIKPLVSLMGASQILLEDCTSYLSIQLWFAPAFLLQLLFQVFFVTEGKPGIGLLLTISAGVINVILDYVFIVLLNMGISGASYATVTGYLVPAVFGMIYFTVSRRSLYFEKPEWSTKLLLESCGNGSSEMVGNLSAGVITFLFNQSMMRFAGETGVAAITIIQYSQFLLNALFMGFAQGIAPVISYNYGSHNTIQLKGVFRTSVIFTAGTSLLVFAISLLFGEQIVTIFAARGSSVYTLAKDGFYLFSISFLFSGANLFSSALFTALSDGKTSAIISIVRTFGLIVISLYTLPYVLGITGVWLAVPVAEIGGLAITIYFILKYRKKYEYA